MVAQNGRAKCVSHNRDACRCILDAHANISRGINFTIQDSCRCASTLDKNPEFIIEPFTHLVQPQFKLFEKRLLGPNDLHGRAL